MANHCTSCGTELREGDRFCAACGAPVGLSAVASETTTPSQPTTYETCEIKWRMVNSLFMLKIVFYAEAIGPQGMYNAGDSKAVNNVPSPVGGIMNANQKRAEPVLKGYVGYLASQGWEPVTEKGPAWYSYRFRRQVRS